MPVMPPQLEKFIRSNGRKGATTLSLLGKYQGVVEALNSELGAKILAVAITQHEYLAQKVLDGSATVEEAAERKALMKIIAQWSVIIAEYEKALKFVEDNVA